MNESVEIASDVLSQAVVAHEFANSGGEPGHGAAGTACANCGTALTGRYCCQCGQSAHVHRSLLHMVEELLHGIFHFETKAWRTLPLLMFRPGRLTREYIDGRRARYVSPLPLFLFMMFLMFMVFSMTGSREEAPTTVKTIHVGDVGGLNVKTESVGEAGREQAQVAGTELKRVKAELAALPASAAQRAVDEQKIQELEAQLAALTWVPKLAGDDSPAASDEVPITQERLHQQLLTNLPWLAWPSLEYKIVHAFNNKELALYKIKSSAAKFAVLLVPITLPFLWLLFAFKRQFKMFDHAVFAFYSLAAMALLMALVAVLAALRAKGLTTALVVFAPPLHMFAQFRGAYGVSRLGAAWRTVAMLIFATLALMVYGLAVVALSM